MVHWYTLVVPLFWHLPVPRKPCCYQGFRHLSLFPYTLKSLVVPKVSLFSRSPRHRLNREISICAKGTRWFRYFGVWGVACRINHHLQHNRKCTPLNCRTQFRCPREAGATPGGRCWVWERMLQLATLEHNYYRGLNNYPYYFGGSLL